MLNALGLNILVGLYWTVFGALMGLVATRRASVAAYFAVGYSFVAAGAWALLPDWPAVARGDVQRAGEMALWLILTGTTGGLGQGAMLEAMKRGHKGASWAIGQSAMVVPFVAAALVWREPLGATGWLGVACVVAAIVLISRTGRDRTQAKASPAWLATALLAFALIGTSQTTIGVCSRWEHWSGRGLRIPIAMSCSALAHWALVAWKRPAFDRQTLKLSALFAAAAMVNLLAIFYCLDLLARHGVAGLFFPLAVGASIVAFSLYSRLRLREHFRRSTVVGIGLSLAGIVLIAWR